MYNLSASHQLFVGLSVDDYLGLWIVSDAYGMHICFRIGEGQIGMQVNHLIDNKETDFKYMVSGSKIKHISKYEDYGQNRYLFGEYKMDAGLINWTTTEGNVSIWSRPGN